MIATTIGLVAGTSVLLSTGTAMAPMNVQQVSTNDVQVYVAKDMDIHLSDTSKLEIIADTKGKVLKAVDGVDNINIKAHKGQVININAQTGWTSATYKINGKSITIPANPKY